MKSGQEEWKVDKILQHEKRGRSNYYLVRWKGFGRKDDTWEPESHLKHAKDALKLFKEQGYLPMHSITVDSPSSSLDSA